MEKWLNRWLDSWIYLGLILWCAIGNTLQQEPNTWASYSTGIGIMLIALSPVLIFACLNEWLRNAVRPLHYWIYWLLAFAICLPATAMTALMYAPQQMDDTIIVGGATWAVIIELALQLNYYLKGNGKKHKWTKAFSLEKAILLTMALISLALGAMTISSMGHARYYNRLGNLLIGGEFNIKAIITHFGTFLGFCMQYFLMYLCGYFFFYLNSRLLVPYVLKQKGILVYILSALAAIAISYPLIAAFLNALPLMDLLGQVFADSPFKMENAAFAAAVIAFSLPVVLAIQFNKQNSRISTLEKDKAETELGLLKQQLNPHFFFNTLNNLYALSLHQSDKTSESILNLSELMRYVIYKGQEPDVPISEEIKYVEDYMELQQMRLKKPLQLTFSRNIGNGEQPIPPLLLIVFVENAFKHGIEPAEHEATLQLQLECTATRLLFTCINSFEHPNQEAPGIGLSNLRRRLQLLYPGKHELHTSLENHTFKATLQLDLS